MKLKNIARKEGQEVNLELTKEKKLVTPNQEFEVSDERAKELLSMKIDEKPIVEKIKEEKTSKEA